MNGRQVLFPSCPIQIPIPTLTPHERTTHTHYISTDFIHSQTDQTRRRKRPEHSAGKQSAVGHETYRVRTRGRRGMERCKVNQMRCMVERSISIFTLQRSINLILKKCRETYQFLFLFLFLSPTLPAPRSPLPHLCLPPSSVP